MAPQRLSAQLARHGGLQKGGKRGNVDIVHDQSSMLQDPKDTAIERRMKAVHFLVLKWPPEQRAAGNGSKRCRST